MNADCWRGGCSKHVDWEHGLLLFVSPLPSPTLRYVFVGGHTKSHRFTTGFSAHGGHMHTYYRTPPQRLAEGQVASVFKEACERFQELLDERLASQLTPVAKCLADFDGTQYGLGYLSFSRDNVVIPKTPPCEPDGWAYGTLRTTGTEGWYPPTYVGVPSEPLVEPLVVSTIL